MKVEVKKAAEYTGHTGSIYGLYACYGKAEFYTGGADGYVVQWKLSEPGNGKLIARLPAPVYSLYFDEERNCIWAGLGNGHIHLIDLKDGKELKNLAIHQKGVFDLKAADGFIFSAGGEGGIGMTDIELGNCIRYQKVSEQSVRVLALHHNEDEIAYGSSDKSVGLLTKNLVFKNKTEQAHESSVFSLCYSSQGQYLLSGGRDAMLMVRDRLNPEIVLHRIPAHNLHIHCLSWNRERAMFLSSSMDKTIKIWDGESFELLKVIDFQRYQSHLNSVNKVAWLDKDVFVSAGDDKKAMVFEINA